MVTVPRFLPPRRAVAVAVAVAAAVLGIGLIAAWWGGIELGVAAALGALTVLPVAVRTSDLRLPLGFGAVIGVLAALATTAEGDAVLLGALVAFSAIAGQPLVRRFGPVVGPAPVVVAAAGTEASFLNPGVAALGVIGGAVAAAAVVHVAVPRRLPPEPLSRRLTWAYMGSLALGSGLAMAVATMLDLPHALWVVVALCAVVVPGAAETRARAIGRVTGTVAGALVAAMLATAVPTWAAVAIAGVALIVGVAWVLVRSRRAAAAWYAVATVLIAGVGRSDEAWGTAIDRIGLTLIGAAIAIALAFGVRAAERSERREDRA